MQEDNISFYTGQVAQPGTLSRLLGNQELFAEVPADWHVIITDIVNSTGAVAGGRHQDVNLIATGSIVAVLNIAFAMGITIPFFFGGDGATFIIPEVMVPKAMLALNRYRENTFANFTLELRAGIVSVKDIYAAGHHLHISKYCRSENFSIPVVLGNGLTYAEQLVKGRLQTDDKISQDDDLDLTGMQCRWDKIGPPADKEEVVTLLILSRDAEKQGPVFSKVLAELDNLYGNPVKRQPISVPELKLKSTFKKMGTEIRARFGKLKYFLLLRNVIATLIGRLYFGTAVGKDYLEKLIEMTDTLVIDGKINTVISGVAAQRKKLERYLDELELKGEIVYGLHVSSASVMSCYVRDMKDGHIHFVDGSEGGYTKAARILKAKLNAPRLS
ncbi:DUF3095 family protein [Ferruginibacter sp. HRS2-29]|uniref:DUF3095 family protein n=1 Tax=Ferruginibacter sp. HRS2-29 TaxID=2487334 RepID=UPI0020CCB9DC|nr:DUF3095 family protein [Ferruginibacter sp. HRS2-29]MCP9751103.1 DUF3095 domain-containing protein [Ferruginibacter sp. HRS2-29]